MTVHTTAPRTFTEISAALEKALVDIKAKKDVFDKASAAVTKASAEYEEVKNNAQFLRNELRKSLDDLMGSEQTNVRQSS